MENATPSNELKTLLEQLATVAFSERDPLLQKIAGLGVPAIEPLLRVFSSSAPSRQDLIALVLKEMNYAAIEPLCRFLRRHEESPVRAAAARALGLGHIAQALEPLLKALADPSPEVRAAACFALGQLGDPHAIPALTDALKDERFAVRQEAAVALGTLGDVRAVEPLITLLEQNDSRQSLAPDVYLRALAKTRDPRAIEALVDFLVDSDANLRRLAAEGLADGGDMRAARPLLIALHDNNPAVRDVALAALHQLGQAEVAPLLAALEDMEPVVRLGALDVLRQIDLQAAPPELLPALIAALEDANQDVQHALIDLLALFDAAAVDPLLDALQSSSPNRRAGAARVLGKRRESRAVPALIDTLEKDAASAVRQAAVRALGAIKDMESAQLLAAMLENTLADKKRDIVEALGDIGHPFGIAPLIQALYDGDYYVQEKASTALGKIGAAALPALAEKMHDEDELVRRLVVRAIGETRHPHSLPYLRQAAQADEDFRVRMQAIISLGDIGGKEVFEDLVQGLGDENSEVRAAAAGGLRDSKDLRAVEPLMAVLDDEFTRVRRSAAGALWILKDSRAVAALTPKLKDPDPSTRRYAIWTLEELGGAAAVLPLADILLADDNITVREYAARALGNLRDARALDSLIGALDDTDSGVRRYAAEALGKLQDGRAIAALRVALNDPQYIVQEAARDALKRLNQTIED